VESGLLLDIVITQSASVLQLLSSKDETLLIRGDAFLVLNLCFHVINGVGWLHVECDGLTRERLHKDLHTAAKTEDKVESGLLLDIVITQSASVLQLLSSKDKTLLIRGDALLVLNLCFHVINGVGRLNIKGDGLACESLHKDLHATPKTEDQVESGLLLDIVITQSASVLQLLSSKDETLLIRGDAFFVLDLRFNIIDGIGRLNIKGDGLACEGFYKNLFEGRQSSASYCESV